MKAILSLIAVISLTACGAAQSQNSTSVASLDGAQPVKDNVLIFTRDDRPVDGALDIVTVIRNDSGSFNVTHRRAIVSLMTGKSIDETKSLGSNMTCTVRLGSYNCIVDRRPVDGALHVVNIANGRFGYDVTHTRSAFDRRNGQEVTTHDFIAGSLELVKLAVLPVGQ